MSKYTIQIKTNIQNICTLAANENINYDNILWWQLNVLALTLKDKLFSHQDLLKRIEAACPYFKGIDSADHYDIVINLDTNTMNKPNVPLYRFDEVNQKECGIDLLIEVDNYFAVYEDGQKLPMKKVEFDVDLLRKEIVTIDEFIEISGFIDELTKEDESDFILNNQLVLRFNNI